jgi:hypothetical protein
MLFGCLIGIRRMGLLDSFLQQAKTLDKRTYAQMGTGIS